MLSQKQTAILVFIVGLALIIGFKLYSRHRTLKSRITQSQKAPPQYEPGLMPKRPAIPQTNASADIQRTMRTIEEINRINKMNAEMRQRQPRK